MLKKVIFLNLSKQISFRYGESVLLVPASSGDLVNRIILRRNFSTKDENKKTSVVSTALNPSVPTNLIQNGQSMVKNKLNSIYSSYEKFSHMDEIREAHQNVENLQEELKIVQQRRREIAKDLNDIRYELQLCYADLANCKKGEPRYLELIRKEYEVNDSIGIQEK